MRFCRNCGKLLAEDQSYCSFCGKMSDGEKVMEVHLQEEGPEVALPTKSSQIPPAPTPKTGLPIATPPLNNWAKVILSLMVAVVPGIGPLAGLITGIVYMQKDDRDRRTFGQALLTFSILFLFLFCSCVFISYFMIQEIVQELPYFFY